MDDFTKFVNDFQKFDVNKILFEVWKKFKVESYIVQLNTEGLRTSQLYEQGKDSKGRNLGSYTPYTIQLKLNGDGDRRVDHITLKDSGDFYESFEVKANSKGFEILADGRVKGGDLKDRFGIDIIGLSEENKNILVEFIEPFFIEEAKKFLQ